jgi:hypothetical protein
MTTVDHHTLIGPYPYRHIPHPTPDVLVRVLDREGVDVAWVGHLPSAFYRDPTPGNAELRAAVASHIERLRPVPTIRPNWPGWRDQLAAVVDIGAPAIRIYPQSLGLGPGDTRLAEVAAACADARTIVALTIRFEDARQRHGLDTSADLPAATIRELARARTGARFLVLGAGRATIEEVYWGLTPEERESIFWDISCIWGPPEDDLAHLLSSIGAPRFVFGSGWPLRLAQTPRANIALLPDELRRLPLATL